MQKLMGWMRTNLAVDASKYRPGFEESVVAEPYPCSGSAPQPTASSIVELALAVYATNAADNPPAMPHNQTQSILSLVCTAYGKSPTMGRKATAKLHGSKRVRRAACEVGFLGPTMIRMSRRRMLLMLWNLWMMQIFPGERQPILGAALAEYSMDIP